MRHPLFQPGETCWARIPTSGGVQWMQCDIVGPLASQLIRDLDLKPIGYAMAYLVFMEDATMEVPFPERDLCKKWQRSDWRSLKCDWYGETRQIWQPPKVTNPRRPQEWKQFK